MGGVEAFPGHLETQNKRRGPQVGSIGEHFHLFDPSKLRLFTYQINATNLRHYVLIFVLIYSALKGPMGTVYSAPYDVPEYSRHLGAHCSQYIVSVELDDVSIGL